MKKGDPYFGLKTRTSNILKMLNLNNREQVADARKDGTLSLRNHGYGWKTHLEIHKWLGLPEPVKGGRKICLHCGKPV